jgi:hypothetical protein
MSYVRIVAVCLAVCGLTATAAQAQAPAMNPPAISGANITFSWTAAAGASSYDLQAGLAPGVYAFTFNVGNVTSIAVTAPAVATYFVRVVANTAGGPVASAEIAVPITSLAAPPAAPTGLQAFRNGTGLLVSWTPGVGGGAPAGYNLRAGLTPAYELGNIPMGSNFLNVGGGLGAGTYYLAVSAVNAGGASAEIATVVTMPAGGACDAPPAPNLVTSNWGSFLTANWSPVPGAITYRLNAVGPGINTAVPFGGNTTSFLYPGLPIGVWNFGIQAQFSCGAFGAVGSSVLNMDGGSLRMEPRAPDPADFANVSYAAGVIRDVANQFPGDVNASCKEHGGNNNFLFRVIARLRTIDKRWGLNWKRANIGDMSQDVIAFAWGTDPDEGTYKLRAWDIIGGHCGSRPGWQFSEITNPMPPNYSLNARWTLLPYIQAGFQP